MIRLQKFKFDVLLETWKTKDTKLVIKELKHYRFCGGGLYMHSRFAGHWAKVDVLYGSGKPVERI